jgi:DNA-binding XRE family transcriptional regulator
LGVADRGLSRYGSRMPKSGRRTPRLADVQRRIDRKRPIGKVLDAPRDPLRHKRPPLSDSRASDTKGLGGLDWPAEASENVPFAHLAQMYRTLTSPVKQSNAPASDNPDVETMGQRIRMCREAQGMTQTDLAKAVGVSRGAVAQWELGIVANIRLQAFLRLCEVLRTTPQYLIFGSDRHRRSLGRPGGTNTP